MAWIEKNERPRMWMHLRMALVAVAIMVLFGAVLQRFFVLQTEEEHLVVRAARQVAGQVTLGAGGEHHLDGHRGYILDRHGYELAISIETPSVFVHPRQVVDREAAATALSEAMGLPRAEILAKLESESSFVWLARKVNPAVGEAVRALKLRGVGLKRESKRYYPGQDLAGQVLGFVGMDNNGLEGIEAAYDEVLRGGAIQLKGLRDARGRVLLTLESPRLHALEGSSVVLSLDQYIQKVTENALERVATEFEAKGALAVVMDPYTGELLALASWPRFNPNRFRDFDGDARRNRAVLDVFEPGSVFKAFGYAAALDKGLIYPAEPIDQERGKLKIGKHTISDTHTIRDMTAERVVVDSSNIGAYKIAKRLGKELFYAYLRGFGFGERSGVGVAGESAGILWPAKRWAEITFSNIAFGQGISVSPLQLAAGFSVLANGGELPQPLLIKEVRDREGQVVAQWEPRMRRRVVSPEAAQLTRQALEKVVLDGTGMRAWVDGYRVGGKTGTAQKVDPRTRAYTNKWMANFVGIAPIDRPEVVVVVMIDEPRKSHYGGVVAAPAFAEIVSQVLPYRGVYPEAVYTGELVALPTPSPEVTGAPTMGEGWPLVRQSLQADMVRVPDFRGMSVRGALQRAQGAGLTLRVEDSGFVVEQWPLAGTLVGMGSQVDVKMGRRYRQVEALQGQEQPVRVGMLQ